MAAFVYAVAATVWLYVLLYYSVFRRTKFCSSMNLKGKTVVITGSSGGVGQATALDLAKRGARVILACRNTGRATAAAFHIRRESGNNQVLVMQLDLADLKSVASFAETFTQSEPRLDLLINNTDVIGAGRTRDGFDLVFGVNFLGHFLLTKLLLQRLRGCGPSRVVTVSSALHGFGSVHFPSLSSRKENMFERSVWRLLQAYCSSKLCGVLFTRELSNRLEGSAVTCYSADTGFIYSDVSRCFGRWLHFLLAPLAKLFLADPAGGAQTTLYCALQEGLEPLSGRFFSDCALQRVGAKARDDRLAQKLWEFSEGLTDQSQRSESG